MQGGGLAPLTLRPIWPISQLWRYQLGHT